MDYRTAIEIRDLAKKSREIASSKNSLEWEAKKLKATKFVPELLKKILIEIKQASEEGDYHISYEPSFWNVKYWFIWNDTLRSILIEELRNLNFECIHSISSIYISWGEDDIS